MEKNTVLKIRYCINTSTENFKQYPVLILYLKYKKQTLELYVLNSWELVSVSVCSVLHPSDKHNAAVLLYMDFSGFTQTLLAPQEIQGFRDELLSNNLWLSRMRP